MDKELQECIEETKKAAAEGKGAFKYGDNAEKKQTVEVVEPKEIQEKKNTEPTTIKLIKNSDQASLKEFKEFLARVMEVRPNEPSPDFEKNLKDLEEIMQIGIPTIREVLRRSPELNLFFQMCADLCETNCDSDKKTQEENLKKILTINEEVDSLLRLGDEVLSIANTPNGKGDRRIKPALPFVSNQNVFNSIDTILEGIQGKDRFVIRIGTHFSITVISHETDFSDPHNIFYGNQKSKLIEKTHVSYEGRKIEMPNQGYLLKNADIATLIFDKKTGGRVFNKLINLLNSEIIQKEYTLPLSHPNGGIALTTAPWIKFYKIEQDYLFFFHPVLQQGHILLKNRIQQDVPSDILEIIKKLYCEEKGTLRVSMYEELLILEIIYNVFKKNNQNNTLSMLDISLLEKNGCFSKETSRSQRKMEEQVRNIYTALSKYNDGRDENSKKKYRIIALINDTNREFETRKFLGNS